MVTTFGILSVHDVHRPDVIYVDCGTPTLPTKLNQTKTIELAKSIKFIISILYSENHYVLLYLKLDTQEAIIYDGLDKDKKLWKNHITYILTRYGIKTSPWSTKTAGIKDVSDGIRK